MGIITLWKAEEVLKKLKKDTIYCVRTALHPKTMKDFLYCYDILELTEEINTPWETHPGKVYGDMSAFVDLEIVAIQLFSKSDPDPYIVRNWVSSIAMFVSKWKMGVDNATIQRYDNLVKPKF